MLFGSSFSQTTHSGSSAPVAGNGCVGGLRWRESVTIGFSIDRESPACRWCGRARTLTRLAAVEDDLARLRRRPRCRPAPAGARCPCPRCRGGSTGSATCTRRSSASTGDHRVGEQVVARTRASRPATSRSCARCRTSCRTMPSSGSTAPWIHGARRVPRQLGAVGCSGPQVAPASTMSPLTSVKTRLSQAPASAPKKYQTMLPSLSAARRPHRGCRRWCRRRPCRRSRRSRPSAMLPSDCAGRDPWAAPPRPPRRCPCRARRRGCRRPACRPCRHRPRRRGVVVDGWKRRRVPLPLHRAGLAVDGDHAADGRVDVDDAVDDDRRRLLADVVRARARSGRSRGCRRDARHPHRAQLLDVRLVDLGQRRVVLVAEIAAGLRVVLVARACSTTKGLLRQQRAQE